MAGAGALPGVTGLVLGGAYRLSDAGLEKVWKGGREGVQGW